MSRDRICRRKRSGNGQEYDEKVNSPRGRRFVIGSVPSVQLYSRDGETGQFDVDEILGGSTQRKSRSDDPSNKENILKSSPDATGALSLELSRTRSIDVTFVVVCFVEGAASRNESGAFVRLRRSRRQSGQPEIRYELPHDAVGARRSGEGREKENRGRDACDLLSNSRSEPRSRRVRRWRTAWRGGEKNWERFHERVG